MHVLDVVGILRDLFGRAAAVDRGVEQRKVDADAHGEGRVVGVHEPDDAMHATCAYMRPLCVSTSRRGEGVYRLNARWSGSLADSGPRRTYSMYRAILRIVLQRAELSH